jgi:hypothetical protein
VERLVRNGAIGTAEPDVHGREQVHVSGSIDGERVDVVVEAPPASDGLEIVRIVTLKPKERRR